MPENTTNKKETRTILVVEDELPLQKAIYAKLEKEDFDVVTARSVDQALNHLEDIENVDAVWLDHYLVGKEDGLDFLASLKSDESKWTNLPVFVVSNTASDAKVKSYIQLGVEKYYTKSDYRLDQIIGDVRKVLDGDHNTD